MEQLEAVLREVGEELATWRARALKAEGEGTRGGPRGESEGGEGRQLRTRVEAARSRLQALVTRLAFLEEQAREAGTGTEAAGGSAR